METQNFNNANQQPMQGGFYRKPVLPNSTGVLVLGILSIVFCWTWGVAGLILGIIALTMSSNANNLYLANPTQYSIASYNNMKAGKTCAIIGTILSAIYLAFIIIAVVFWGTFFTGLSWDRIY